MCRHSFPGAPVPRDLGWNSGACVSWHSMARLQPCTEVVSCTALSALCSAHSGAGSKPSLRLCRPPLVVARGEETAQSPAGQHPASREERGARAALQLLSVQVQLASPRSGLPAQHTHALPRPSQLLFSTFPGTLENLPLPLTDAVVPRKPQSSVSGDNAFTFLVAYLMGKQKGQRDLSPKTGEMDEAMFRLQGHQLAQVSVSGQVGPHPSRVLGGGMLLSNFRLGGRVPALHPLI